MFELRLQAPAWYGRPRIAWVPVSRDLCVQNKGWSDRMKQIEIDLDVNRAIENGRISFDESHNQVLRRLLAIDGRPVRRNVQTPGVLRSPRSSGAYSAMIGATPIEGNSLKELLRRVILKGDKLQPGFIDGLARLPTARGRHIVAPTPHGRYPKSPQLVE